MKTHTSGGVMVSLSAQASGVKRSNHKPRWPVWGQRRAPVFGACLVSLLTIVLATAQVARASVTGSISGRVTDSTGAVVPGATAIAVNTETGIQQTTETNATGIYSFSDLPVGHYSIEIRHEGFRIYRQTGLVIDANTKLSVDATLQVGALTQEVNVSAAAVQVETTNTQLGEVISSSKMTTVPLDGRSYTDLLSLQPGVVPVNAGTYGSFSVSGDLNPGNMSVNGQRESANGFMVNGGTVQEDAQMGTTIIPNLDSLAEFRILTANFDAEYGNYSGGQVNVITKSGSNEFHGDAFDFLRNTNLDARGFYDPSRGKFNQNQFGGTFGGPIKHDKVFFFADYQGTRQIIGQSTGDIPVPSVADRNGNLSDLATQLTGSVTGSYWAGVLAKELGYPVSVGEPYYTPGCASSSQCVLPGAVIPPSAFSPPATPLTKYIPLPNAGPFFNTSAYNQTLRDDKGSYRADANTRLGMISAYFFLDDYGLNSPYAFDNLPGFNAVTQGRGQMLNLGDVKSIGPTAVNEFRIQYMRNVTNPNKPQGGAGVNLTSQGFVTGPNTLGIVNVNPNLVTVESVGFNNFSIGTAGYSSQYNNTYQVMDNYTKVIGTHSLKFGGGTHYDQLYNFGFSFNWGSFGFSGTETGSDWADFLLGAPSSYVQGIQLPEYNRTRYFGLYGQDSWRFRPNLTINYGLRYDVSSPWWEAHNQYEAIMPAQQSVVFPGSPLGWDFPGDPGVPSTLAPTRYNNFAPRIGLAYSPSASGGWLSKLLGGAGKTSVRAGFGVFFTAFEEAPAANAVGDAPFGFFYVNPVPPLFATPFVDRQTGNSEGQRFPTPTPPLNVSATNPDKSINWAQFLPISSSPVFFHANHVPYAEDYSFTIQRQFGANTLLSLGYVGTQGHRLLSDLEANPGNAALCLSLSQPSEVMPNTPTCGPSGENGVYFPVTGGVVNSTRAPLGPNFGADAYFDTMANSNYSSFQASLRHTSGRIEFLVGYTYSKALDNSSGWGGTSAGMIDPFNPARTKALSAFDLTHNFVASYSYQLPFDKFWRANQLSSGWIVAGITHFSTGLPVTLNEVDDRSLTGTNTNGPGSSLDEPNFTPGPLNIIDPRKQNLASLTSPYFNNSLFTPETLGQLGTANRRFFHGPGLNNFDLALLKDLKLTESKTLQFRAEFFNTFNHAQFGGPNGTINSSLFGFVTGASSGRIGQVALKLTF